MILFQIGLDSTRSNMLLQLYSQLIKETCFNVLRTKEQLGYIVFSGVWRQGGVHGLQFIVQSHKKPKFLDSRIENFIKETRETIKVSTKLHESKVLIVLPRTSWSKTDKLSFAKIILSWQDEYITPRFSKVQFLYLPSLNCWMAWTIIPLFYMDFIVYILFLCRLIAFHFLHTVRTVNDGFFSFLLFRCIHSLSIFFTTSSFNVALSSSKTH